MENGLTIQERFVKDLTMVSVKKYIPEEWDDSISEDKRHSFNCKKGTGCFSEDFPETAFFHQWIGTGDGRIIAVIITADGTATWMDMRLIKFPVPAK